LYPVLAAVSLHSEATLELNRVQFETRNLRVSLPARIRALMKLPAVS
jgi:hypothetical protein